MEREREKNLEVQKRVFGRKPSHSKRKLLGKKDLVVGKWTRLENVLILFAFLSQVFA